MASSCWTFLAHGDQVLARHQFIDLLRRIGGKTDVAVGEDADETTGLAAALAGVLDDRNAGNAMGAHQGLRIGKRCIGSNGDGIDHHAGFELLDLPDLFGLQLRRKIAVDDAHAAGLRHGDGEARFSDCIHGRRKQRQIEFDVGSDAGADIGLAGHDFGVTRLQQDIIKCQCQRACRGFNDFCHDQFLTIRLIRLKGAPRWWSAESVVFK